MTARRRAPAVIAAAVALMLGSVAVVAQPKGRPRTPGTSHTPTTSRPPGGSRPTTSTNRPTTSTNHPTSPRTPGATSIPQTPRERAVDAIKQADTAMKDFPRKAALKQMTPAERASHQRELKAVKAVAIAHRSSVAARGPEVRALERQAKALAREARASGKPFDRKAWLADRKHEHYAKTWSRLARAITDTQKSFRDQRAQLRAEADAMRGAAVAPAARRAPAEPVATSHAAAISHPAVEGRHLERTTAWYPPTATGSTAAARARSPMAKQLQKLPTLQVTKDSAPRPARQEPPRPGPAATPAPRAVVKYEALPPSPIIYDKLPSSLPKDSRPRVTNANVATVLQRVVDQSYPLTR